MKSQVVADDRGPETAEIRSRPCPECYLCGAAGEPLYEGLTDRLFDAPGIWNLKRCHSPRCGLLWLDPMPLEEDIGRAYANYFTHEAPDHAPQPAQLGWRSRAANLFRSAYLAWRFNYGKDAGKPLRWLFALPILLWRLECDELDIPLRYLAVAEKGRMLDVGCGDGTVVKLAQDLGWNAEGIDFDPEAIANARRNGLNVHAGMLKDQRYSDDSFDLVLMSHVIEHVHDALGTLREIRRIVRPGGMLALMTPNAGSWGQRRFGSHCAQLDPPRHLQLFNGRNLGVLAKRAGFAQTTVSSTLRITHFVFFQSRLIQARGRGNMKSAITRADIAYGRRALLAEMLMRLWDPFAADELLLEARK